MSTRTTRLAPSTTGDLHLGHARTFLLTWALARREGWRIVLRFEDLDPERATADSRDRTLDVLAFLGIDHDGDPLTQSADPAPYRAAMRAARTPPDPAPITNRSKSYSATHAAPVFWRHSVVLHSSRCARDGRIAAWAPLRQRSPG